MIYERQVARLSLLFLAGASVGLGWLLTQAVTR